MTSRWWLLPIKFISFFIALFLLIVLLAGVLIYPSLPSLSVLTDYQPKLPLRIFTADGALLGEFGEERRSIVKYEAVPKKLIQAILAAEDDRFFEHGGVDFAGIARAAIANVTRGGAREGASTITMQVARNFFLSPEKTLTRKFNEVLMTFKIEHNLSKNQILELYINQIYLGQRAYGFAAAAQTYFGKPLDKLSVAEAAMLAALPKAPSRNNPVSNPVQATKRQHYVLGRMLELKFITPQEYQTALGEKLRVRHDVALAEVPGDYIAEMARQFMVERYGDATYTNGFKIVTTIRRQDQEAANFAVRQNVMDYDRRHGWRGPEEQLTLPPKDAIKEETLEELLQEYEDVGDLIPALVLATEPKKIKVFAKNEGFLEIGVDGLWMVQKSLADKSGKSKFKPGIVIRVNKDAKGRWQVVQLPTVEAALVSLSPGDGAIRALVGGFNFARNKFNHVIQAWRQPGSSFKPFIYSAALEKGLTPATVINDAPLVFDAAQTGSKPWEPKNYDGTYSGPIRMRTALIKSKNMVSIRILQTIGPRYAQDYITRFGFNAEQHPAYLTMALGAGSVTPFQMASAYSVFANGGYRISPYYIERLTDARGKVLAQANPVRAGENAERAIDARNAFIMTSMMKDVVRFGTAARAMQLGRGDLAGKTGTTNDQVDAWFCGFNANLVAVAWIGYDQPRSLGGSETGAQAALPMWMMYMGKVLKGVPETAAVAPEGVVTHADSAGKIEYFYKENVPEERPGWGEDSGAKDDVKNQIF
jgi:penicillin-binding protein 1A